MKMLVGLGNPGKGYADTRHNVGFMVVDALAARHGLRRWRRRYSSRAADIRVAGEQVLLLKPQTYMNESGFAVREALDAAGLRPEDVMIVCDDFNLPLGTIRIRARGSSGGHHGLDSVIRAIGTSGFPRLRVGIGNDERRRDRDFVLSPFDEDEVPIIRDAISRAVEAVETWVESGLQRCQNLYNAPPKEGAYRGISDKEVSA